MIPVSFAGLSGWLHDAPGRRGVLICPPHGFEELCARAAMRDLADRLAAAGMPVLRFDWPGSGDSSDLAHGADLVAALRGSVSDALDWMCGPLGVDEVVLIGCRLGSLVAALATEADARVRAIALVGTVASGRSYVREMRMMSQVMSPQPGNPAIAAEPGIDICGFHLPQAAARDIETLKLEERGGWPASVLLMAQQPAAVRALAQRIGAAAVTHEFKGYADLFCDPTVARIPQEDWLALTAWCAGLGPNAPREPRPVASAPLSGDGWRERAVVFGAAPGLAGVLCEPDAQSCAAGRRRPVLFLDGGRNYHIGWARQTVAHARALAAAGIASLRFDFSGIGDSPPPGPGQQPPIYSPSALHDTRAALDWLAAEGYPDAIGIGVCSGAYAALHGARADVRLRHIVLVNLQCLEWTPALGENMERWLAIRRLEINVAKASEEASGTLHGLTARMMQRLLPRARALAGRVRRVVRPGRKTGDGAPLADPVPWFKALRKRGANVLIVFSRGDPGLEILEPQWGPEAMNVRAAAGIRMVYIEDADHNLSSAAARGEMRRLLLDFVAADGEA